MTRRRPGIASIENVYRGLRGLPALRPPTRRIVVGGVPSAQVFGRATVELAGVSHGHSNMSGDLFVKRAVATMPRTGRGTVFIETTEIRVAIWRMVGSFVGGFAGSLGLAQLFGAEWVGLGAEGLAAGAVGGVVVVIYQELKPDA